MAAVVIALKNRLKTQESSGSRAQLFELTENQLHAQEQADAPSVKRRPMPAKHERVLDAVLLKRTDSIKEVWQPRLVVLTEKCVFFGKEDVEIIGDSIRLEDVTSVYATNELEESGSMEERVPIFRDGHVLEIATAPEGFNAGRNYLLKTKSLDQSQAWAKAIREKARCCADKKERLERSKMSTYQRAQRLCGEFYGSTLLQSIVAVLIVANMLVQIVDVEIHPDPESELSANLESMDMMFTIVFTVELAMNMFANWTFADDCFVPAFFLDGWNMFDFIVVVISVLSKTFNDLPGISILRLLRVFRVLRLFPRLKSLRMIINALTAAILPCANAFMVLLLFTCIYAVVAVTLFKDADPVQFGNFSASVYSMFQVCTGDGWSTDIVRPLFREDGHVDPVVVAFFVSYILLAGYFLLNIIVAVLLDEFVRSVDSERSATAFASAVEKAKGTQRCQGSLDPLLMLLFRYDTSKDLTEKIHGVFDFLDWERDEMLTYLQFVSRIGLLVCLPRMHISRDDWEMIMYGRHEIKGTETPVSKSHFVSVIRAQMAAFCQRNIESKLASSDQHENAESNEILFVLKQVLLCMDRGGGECPLEDVDGKVDGHGHGSKEGNSYDILGRVPLEDRVSALDAKIDTVDSRVENVGKQMSLLMQHLGVSAGSGGLPPVKAECLSHAQQTSEVEGQMVSWELAAAAQIRTAAHDLVQSTRGETMATQATGDSALSKKTSAFLDGAMSDSDSSDSVSSPALRSSLRYGEKRRRPVATNGVDHPGGRLKTVDSFNSNAPSLSLSHRKDTCPGCDECLAGCSAVGVIIYDRMFSNEPGNDKHQEDDTQELRSICITRPTRVRKDPAPERDLAVMAQGLLDERLPPSSILCIDAQAFLDTPIHYGQHWQRCFLVPKSSVSPVLDGLSDDGLEGVMKRARNYKTGHA